MFFLFAFAKIFAMLIHVFKASIVQRGGTLGVVHSIPREELDYDQIVAIFQEYGKPPKALPQPETSSLALPPPA
jgi:hypothetical protein